MSEDSKYPYVLYSLRKVQNYLYSADSSLYSCTQHRPFTWILDVGIHCMSTWHILQHCCQLHYSAVFFKKPAPKVFVAMGCSRKLHDTHHSSFNTLQLFNRETREGLKRSTNGSKHKLASSKGNRSFVRPTWEANVNREREGVSFGPGFNGVLWAWLWTFEWHRASDKLNSWTTIGFQRKVL